MRVFIAVLVLIFSFQSWTKADDISDFEIEGMSIGDSLLDYFSEEEIKDNKRNYVKNKKYYVVGEGAFNLKIYDQLDISDPVRTNLRDASGNTVMGGFCAMAGNTIFFEVISSDSLLGR